MDRLENRLKAYEKLVESQDKTIELLEMQLRNERLKNSNIERLVRNNNSTTSMED